MNKHLVLLIIAASAMLCVLSNAEAASEEFKGLTKNITLEYFQTFLI